VAIQRLRNELRFLLSPGRVGEFDHVELIEVIGTPPRAGTLNVLSVAVLAEGRPDVSATEKGQFLTGRIRIDGFKDWSFGVMRTLRPVAALDAALATLALTKQWALSGTPLETGNLQPIPPMFAPPDGTVTVPLNKVLKNNFWAGSHVLRLTDQDKVLFMPFFADRRRLQMLSDAVSSAVPIAFANLADLLGDVLIQVPVTILMPKVTAPRGAEYSDVVVTWRRGSTSRPLMIAARTRWDKLLAETSVSEHFLETVRLPIDGHRQPIETEIWDTEMSILVGATSPTSTLKAIALNTHVVQPEPRLFTVPDLDGCSVAGRVRLTEARISFVGQPARQDANYWLGRRQDIEERRRLEESRDFVQYRPQAGTSDARARALADLRFLINKHGAAGVDLWDPYLTGEDLLRTLFWCSHSGAPLRALTDGRDSPSNRPLAPSTVLSRLGFAAQRFVRSTSLFSDRIFQRISARSPMASRHVASAAPFSDRQRDILHRYGGNRQGLRLEYRTRWGPKGWGFHDRFLIFPNGRDGPLAWSLGTSINSLGLAHHILQRVSNPALVAGAFEDLWAELDESHHVVWRSW
jgi:hypothetical protein